MPFVQQPNEVPIARSYGILQLDSRDRISGQPLSNFSYDASKVFPMNGVTSIAPWKLQFVWSTPNVNVRNNRFTLIMPSVSSAPKTVTVAEGWYTNTELAAALQAQLIASVSSTLTVTLQSKTNYFVITDTDSSRTFTLLKSQAGSPDLLDMMGFNYCVGWAASTSFTSGFPTLTYTRSVKIVSSQMCQFAPVRDDDSSSHVTNILFIVYLPFNESPVDGNYSYCRPGTDIQFEEKNLKWFAFDSRAQLANVDIRLVDEWGQDLYTPPGAADFCLTFKMTAE